MKDLKATEIPGVFEIDFFHLKDDRGTFVKTLHQPFLENAGLEGGTITHK